MYFINQITQDDCAFASLKILLANLRNDERYLYLKEDEKHGAYSYLELCDFSKQFGVELIGFKVESKDELKHADTFPMILTLKSEDSIHSVCLFEIKNKHAILLDPTSGKVKIKLEKLFDLWDGTGLLIKDVEKEKQIEDLPIKKEHNHVLDYIFQFLAGSIFLFSLITMGLENFSLFSFIGLGVSVIFEIISRIIKVHKMKKFDSKISNILENIDPKNYNQLLIRKEKYKESVFSNKNNFLYYLFVSIFLVFTIIVGDPRNISCVILPIIIAIIESQIFIPKEKNANNEIEKLECKLSLTKSQTKVRTLYDGIHLKSYKFADFLFIKKCIGICLFGTCAILTLYFLNTLNLINFLFLIFTEVYLYQNLLSLMSYENGVREREICFMRFINIL